MNSRLILSRAIEPDTHPELPIDIGKNGDGVGSWVHERKHRLLATYIDAARAAANSSKFSNWIYLDPFCGPGRMRTRGESFTRPGGAMVAWRQSQISGAPFDLVFVGDLDETKALACEARLTAAGCNAKAFPGPAVDTVDKMVRAVPPRSLVLVYIDPYNLSLLSYEMIATLARLPKVDFVVHFSTMDWLRNSANARDPEHPRFDDVSPGWRERLNNVSDASLPVALFQDWYAKIRALDFEFSRALSIYNDSQHEIYKLVFFARHPLPLRLWGDVSKEPQMGFFGD